MSSPLDQTGAITIGNPAVNASLLSGNTLFKSLMWILSINLLAICLLKNISDPDSGFVSCLIHPFTRI